MALGFIGLSFVIALVWILLSSVNLQASVSLSVPESLKTGDYTAVFNIDHPFRPLWNSAVLSLGTALLTVIAGALAAYPLSRYKMRFTRGLVYTILFGSCLPITAMMVPVYSLFVRLNLLDSMKQPASVAIYNFLGMYGTIAYGKLAALSILHSTRVLVLYSVMQNVSATPFPWRVP